MNLISCNFKKEMLPLTYKWLQDDELKKLTNTPDFSKEDQKKWFKQIRDDKSYKIWVICLKSLPIGVFGIKNIINKEGEYWGYIGEKEYWGKGIGKWMIKESIIQSKKNSLCKLYLYVLKDNKRAIKLYHKNGFKNVSSKDGMLKMEIEIK